MFYNSIIDFGPTVKAVFDGNVQGVVVQAKIKISPNPAKQL
jgi:uncharacterized protein (DUF736 family)